MKKYLADAYLFLLWVLCGEGFYSLFQAWWPSQRPFWNGWIGQAVITLLAIVLLIPAAIALDAFGPAKKP